MLAGSSFGAVAARDAASLLVAEVRRRRVTAVGRPDLERRLDVLEDLAEAIAAAGGPFAVVSAAEARERGRLASCGGMGHGKGWGAVETVSAGDAALLLGRTARRVGQMCAAGEFAGAHKAGRDWRIPLSTIEERVHG